MEFGKWVTVLWNKTLMKRCNLYYLTFNHLFLSLCHTTSTPAIQLLWYFQNSIARWKPHWYLNYSMAIFYELVHKQGISAYPGPVSFQILFSKSSTFSLFRCNLTKGCFQPFVQLSAIWSTMFLLCQILWLCPLYLSQISSSFTEHTGKGFQTLHIISVINSFKYLIFFLRYLLWLTF